MTETTPMPQIPEPAAVALDWFPRVFQDDVVYAGNIGAAWAPGRVNLIGEHTAMYGLMNKIGATNLK